MGYLTKINNDGYSVTIEVMEGKTPYIGNNGNWWVDGKDTGKPSFGTAPTVSEDGYWIINGEVTQYRAIGQDGKGITSITKTNTVGIVDTYTINYSDGTTSTFDLTNGDKGEQGISPTIGNNGNWWVGDYDTGVKAQGIQGEDGRGIVSVIETSVSGTIHTFTLTYTDGTTSNFDIDIPNSGGSSNPDNEYISLDSLNKLTFSNKVAGYDADEQKIVYVKKDTVLDSSFFSANTKYVFKFKHDLGGMSLMFPPNVTLEFQGGRLENGNLVGDNTKIVASPYLIFKDIIISKSGTWDIEKAYSHWFNCSKNGYVIDYKTFTEDLNNNVDTGITTDTEPLTNGNPPLLAYNSTTNKWRIGSTDTTFVAVSRFIIPVLKLDGNRYLLDNLQQQQFEFNSTKYLVGQYTATSNVVNNFVTKKPDGSSFEDDTYKLNQLSNFKAKHTVIGDKGDVFMIRPTLGRIENSNINDINGLFFRDTLNQKIEINGILKVIPNNLASYNTVIFDNCKGLKLIGEGAIHGDICEHLYTVDTSTNAWTNSGEWGHCAFLSGSEGAEISLNFEQAWGDGLSVGWSQLNGLNNENNYLTIENSKFKCCRRTGLVIEKGDHVTIKHNLFDQHYNRRGTATYAAIDIEPFGNTDAPVRYCNSFDISYNHFENCTVEAVRLERCLNASVKRNTFKNNGIDIEVIQCSASSIDLNNSSDRTSVFGNVIIDSNYSENSKAFISGYVPLSYYKNDVVVSNNIVRKCDYFINECYFERLRGQNNTVHFLNISLLHKVDGINGEFYDMLVHHYQGYADKEYSTFINEMTLESTTFIHKVNFDTFKLVAKVGDLSHTSLGFYVINGTFIQNGGENLYPTEIIGQAIFKKNMFNNCSFKELDVTCKSTDTINCDLSSILSFTTVTEKFDYKNEYGSNQLSLIDRLIKGDIIIDNNQKGIVITGSHLRPPHKSILWITGVTPKTNLTGQTVFFNEDKTRLAISKQTQNELAFGSDLWNPNAENGLFNRFAYYEIGTPIIQWEDVGVTENITNVTLYNSKGRKVLETTTNVVYEHDGTRFNVMDNISVGLTAERPLKATTKDGFRYFDTETQTEYVYKKNIDDWIIVSQP